MNEVTSLQVFKAIRRIVRAIDLRSREVSRKTGLTIPQIVVLQSIRDLGEVTTKALSENADLSSATVVTILDKVEEKGLIERYRSKSDRRIVHAKLTKAGLEMVSNLPGLLHEEFENKFDQCTRSEQETLLRSIEQIAEMLNAHNLDAAPMLVTTKVPE